MNGYEICKKAFLMMGFDNGNEIMLHNHNSARDFEMINQIASDLKLVCPNELSDETGWSDEETQAVISGVAMLLSFIEGEIVKNQWFTSVYNAKRAALLGRVEKIEDTLPVGESGDV